MLARTRVTRRGLNVAAKLVLACSLAAAGGVLAPSADAFTPISPPIRYQIGGSGGGNVDYGGGVLLANDKGGFYMGRLMPGWSFDRHSTWELGGNSSDYAWAYAYGHSQACLWVGPSAGVSGAYAGTWATNIGTSEPDRCNSGLNYRDWLSMNNGSNIGSAFNCTPGTAAGGTSKPLNQASTPYRNLTWSGGTYGYDGGTLADPITNSSGTTIQIAAGTPVWYRYTTRDGTKVVAFIRGWGWAFLPRGVIDNSQTGWWSTPDYNPTGQAGFNGQDFSQPCNDTELHANDQLTTGNPRMQTSTRKDSPPRRFQLVMQTDGNLVLYQTGVGALWSTGTYGTNASRAVMQGDGNFVLYDPAGNAVWATNTWGNPGAWLAVQADGNVVVYSSGGAPLWASNTCCR